MFALLLLLLLPLPSARAMAAASNSGSGCSQAGRTDSSGSCSAPNRTRVAAGSPGLVLIQGRYVASLASHGRECAPFEEWPHLDRVTCGDCKALVLTAPYDRCDDYCHSFGHVCEAAAEEERETCAVRRSYRCDQRIRSTSDMLCTCRRPAPGQQVPVPTPAPSSPTQPCGAGGNCDHCDSAEAPMHAGCLVVKDGRLLAVRITYGSRKFDIPGGQTDWKESASCTARRETFEETGYEVTPTRLIASNLHGGGFNLYRCDLLKENPTKSPDAEVSEVVWLSRDEVQQRVSEGQWRFREAQHYADWML